MKYSNYTVIILSIILLITGMFSCKKEVSPDTVAVVNGQELSRIEYGEWLYKNVNTAMLFENYISTILFKNEADRLGLNLDTAQVEKELNKRINTELNDRKREQEKYEKWLKEAGLTEPEFIEKLKNRIRNEVEADLYASAIIFSKKEITDQMISNKYNELYGLDGKTFSLRHIYIPLKQELITLDDPAYTESLVYAEKKAEAGIKKVLKQLQEKGVTKFSEIAALESDDSATRYDGGYLGVFDESRFDEEINAAVPTLKVDEISDIIKTDRGYHILKVDAIEGENIEISHILKKVDYNTVININVLNEDKKTVMDEMNKLMQALSNGENFDALAQKHSHAFNSIYKADITGRYLNLYGMELREGLDNLKKDEPGIVETSTGIHLILIDDVKEIAFTDELKDQLINDIKNGPADSKDINALAVKLLDKSDIEIY